MGLNTLVKGVFFFSTWQVADPVDLCRIRQLRIGLDLRLRADQNDLITFTWRVKQMGIAVDSFIKNF